VRLTAAYPGNAEVGNGLEVGRTLLHNEHPDRATGDPPNHRADGEHTQQRAHRPTHAPISGEGGGLG